MKPPKKKSSGVVATAKAGPLTRSVVPPTGLRYGEYRQHLRRDFYYSCAYCTMAETESHGMGFEIDHYEPRTAAPHLEDDYGNLLYACETCNNMKGDRCPPPKARADGHPFFRPDQDIYDEHFQTRNSLVESETNVGKFSIDFLELNRLSLRTLREIRARLRNALPLYQTKFSTFGNSKSISSPRMCEH